MKQTHINKLGYVVIRTGSGYSILEHRQIMETMLGRPLEKGENVHHRNGVKHDNRPENLELWYTKQPSGVRVVDSCVDALVAMTEPDYLAFMDRVRRLRQARACAGFAQKGPEA